VTLMYEEEGTELVLLPTAYGAVADWLTREGSQA
jgi:hypothetical protein